MTLTTALKNSQEIYWNKMKQPLIKMAKCGLVYTGISSPWMNGVVTTDLQEENTYPAIEMITNFYKTRHAPFSWWTDPASEPPNFQKALRAFGGEFHGNFDGMILEFDALTRIIQEPSELAINLVSSNEDLNAFIDVLIQSYEAEAGVASAVKTLLMEAGLEFPVFHFLGKIAGIPVSVGSLFIHDGMAGIYHVGTIPSVRKKGFATAIMREALKVAHFHGCKSSFLTSTPMANNIYSGLGYKTTASFRFYTVC